jgi:hypothetical protein
VFLYITAYFYSLNVSCVFAKTVCKKNSGDWLWRRKYMGLFGLLLGGGGSGIFAVLFLDGIS